MELFIKKTINNKQKNIQEGQKKKRREDTKKHRVEQNGASSPRNRSPDVALKQTLRKAEGSSPEGPQKKQVRQRRG